MVEVPFKTYLKKISLKAKFSLTFGLIAFLICVILSILVFKATQGVLISNSESFSSQAVLTDIALIDNVNLSNATVSQILDSIRLSRNSELVLDYNGTLYFKGGLPVLDVTDSIKQFSTQRNFNHFLNINGNYYVISKTSFSSPYFGGNNYFMQLDSFNTLNDTLNILAMLLGAFSIFFTFLGVLIFQIIYGRFQKRLNKITVTVAKIPQGGPIDRLEINGHDELDELATRINQVSEYLNEKVDQEQRFAADVSHELRSPLHTLSATAGILINHVDEMAPNAKQAVTMLNAEIERFSNLVIDLLEIFRVDSQLADTNLEPVPIYRLIFESLKVSNCDAKISYNDRDVQILVEADKKKFERAVANIVSNAKTYANGLKIVTISKLVDTVLIYFDDDGPGIDKEFREQVFERFNRGVKSGSRGHEKGSGLGLTLVSKIVLRHKGKVFVDTSQIGGARIVIELPIYKPID